MSKTKYAQNVITSFIIPKIMRYEISKREQQAMNSRFPFAQLKRSGQFAEGDGNTENEMISE